jgi:glycolate oxidase FAD binding subunit
MLPEPAPHPMIAPTSEAELAAALADAAAPLRVQGGGTRGMAGQGGVLSTADLRGITLYEPGALTLVAAAGTPVAEIEAVLARDNQRLAFEPMDHRGLLGTSGEPTIGGVVAGNISGPRRIQAGAARDFLLGVRLVDGGGRVLKNGGRVMKNVTGYDLVKLMAGSWGTLGVLSEVSFKVLPRVETEATLVLTGLSMAAAVEAMSAALGAPYEVSGAAHDPGADRTLLRIEGFEASVGYRADRLAATLAAFGPVERLDAEASQAVWVAIRDVAPFHDATGDVWRLSCRPSHAPGLAARLEADGLLFDWGGGLIWIRVPPGTDLRARTGPFDGHATLVRAAPQTRDRLGTFQPETPAVAALARGIRARFDPKGILNPGLMDQPEPAEA